MKSFYVHMYCVHVLILLYMYIGGRKLWNAPSCYYSLTIYIFYLMSYSCLISLYIRINTINKIAIVKIKNMFSVILIKLSVELFKSVVCAWYCGRAGAVLWRDVIVHSYFLFIQWDKYFIDQVLCKSNYYCNCLSQFQHEL